MSCPCCGPKITVCRRCDYGGYQCSFDYCPRCGCPVVRAINDPSVIFFNDLAEAGVSERVALRCLPAWWCRDILETATGRFETALMIVEGLHMDLEARRRTISIARG